TAFVVNSAGDCVAGTYGWKPVGCTAGVAMTPDLNIEFCYNPGLVCETIEQRSGKNCGGQAGHRAGGRAQDQPAFPRSPLPVLAVLARRCWRSHDLLAGARRAVSPQRRADPEGPRLLRGVRRPRCRLLRS